jgi:hypothetical protein
MEPVRKFLYSAYSRILQKGLSNDTKLSQMKQLSSVFYWWYDFYQKYKVSIIII